ncbi:MAG: alpha/beta fold hydrolase [Sporichthyaceae bacterium]
MTDITAKKGILSRTKLHAQDVGTGRPVVLLHGWPLSSESWADQIPALAVDGYRVVAYDRRGFGHSDKPKKGYDYDTLADDLHEVMEELDLRDATLVGFSMGGGEVARYVATYGEDRIRSVVFAAAVTPFLAKSADNPDGPLTPELATQLRAGLEKDRESFFDEFTKGFFSANGELKVSEQQRLHAVALAMQSDERAALECMDAWAGTDFRQDLLKVNVPALVLHGDADATVPLEGSGARTAAAIPRSELEVVADAPHGLNVSHASAFNDALLAFLAK